MTAKKLSLLIGVTVTLMTAFNVCQVNRVLPPDRWEAKVAKVPGQPENLMELVSRGPNFELKVDLPRLDPSEFRVFEGDQAIAVLKEAIDHCLLKK